jgi:hypothetical protein
MKMLTKRIDKSFESTLSYKAVSSKSATNGFKSILNQLRPAINITSSAQDS